MKNKTFTALVLLFSLFNIGHSQVYNQFFEKQEVTNLKEYVESLTTTVVQQRNKVNKKTVVELFEQGTGKFLGFRVSDEDFDFSKVPYLKSKDVNYLLDDHNPAVAIAIVQNDIIAGMTSEEAEMSWDKPNRIDKEGDQQIMRYDKGVINLIDGLVVSSELF